MSRLGNLGGKLYRGESSIDFVGRQKMWYLISGAVLLISIVSLLTFGLNQGIEFKGGSVFQFNVSGTNSAEVTSAVKSAGVVKEDPIVQKASVPGSSTPTWRVQTETLSSTQAQKLEKAISDKYNLGGIDKVSQQTVGASWGQDISKKALQGLIIFLILVAAYLSIAFEWRMAVAALVALAHDILITTGIYSLVQFEVTPSTVVGLLTILGYSLYDTVVVFDKVRENTRGLAPGSRVSYSQAANLAVNQTLVRSINTTVIALLPVAGLLFIGAGFMGAGTLKDLALVLFVGMLVGAYSSICIATPILADLKERDPRMKAVRNRIKARESSAKRKAREANKSGEAKQAVTLADVTSEDDDDEPEDDVPVTTVRKVVQQGPRQQPKRGTRRDRK
jgi:preprotein translocase subunit SecF